ncbi:MAG: 3'-5' exonuclease domain-containing protein 2 [Bacteroides sp.]|nr:3'-5' exonuclease domain-containing protein 2 [Bacteroides sp.]MCM1413388.1 3'-5' exonuclease domain-containing protein 2 [Bacteroides sp.]MCM1471926.1 3'-5' exonuclease domain-containing protein 2 [Bacteroides sp.]
MMTEPLQISIPKELISDMPQAVFGGDIRVIDNAADARAAVRYLSRQPIVGFDTETRPTFKRGVNRKVALVQLSTDDVCFLFRICNSGLTEPLRHFFEIEEVKKIGLSIKDDFHGLHKLAEFTPGGFVELQDYVHRFNIVDASLQRIYAILFGERISKAQRLTNWEAPELTQAQQHYAALDAFACLKIYRHLTAGDFDPRTSPYIVVPEDNKEETDKKDENP